MLTWDDSKASRVANFLQAVAHPKRLLLLTALSGRTLSASTLARAVGVSQPTAFRHLQRLQDAGIVTANRHATVMRFAIASPALLQLLFELENGLVRF
ncbi:metalloregulator ArsR/SmtB family transcription factor [Ensifer sp.]|uniref:ArsR/SmtB family transcription factor n=1 Tax=Ensifer sp. TaxID=1872086 RepID=UPI0028A274EF|nr:metalloregulator ArsR/SmtB family transcription factor [Ensifer sp.]